MVGFRLYNGLFVLVLHLLPGHDPCGISMEIMSHILRLSKIIELWTPIMYFLCSSTLPTMLDRPTTTTKHFSIIILSELSQKQLTQATTHSQTDIVSSINLHWFPTTSPFLAFTMREKQLNIRNPPLPKSNSSCMLQSEWSELLRFKSEYEEHLHMLPKPS